MIVVACVRRVWNCRDNDFFILCGVGKQVHILLLFYCNRGYPSMKDLKYKKYCKNAILDTPQYLGQLPPTAWKRF